jgi:hypothetical protein
VIVVVVEDFDYTLEEVEVDQFEKVLEKRFLEQ